MKQSHDLNLTLDDFFTLNVVLDLHIDDDKYPDGEFRDKCVELRSRLNTRRQLIEANL